MSCNHYYRSNPRHDRVSIEAPRPPVEPPVIVITTAWNPADKSAAMALSNSNLTAAAGTGSIWVRGDVSHGSGKYYWEAKLDNSWNANSGIGLAPSTTNPIVGGISSGLTAVAANGGCYVSGVSFAALGAIGSGASVGIAADLGARLVWYRVLPSGNWNASGAADPGAGVGGINISSLVGNLFPIFAAYASPDQATGNFGATGFMSTSPTGFSPWST